MDQAFRGELLSELSCGEGPGTGLASSVRTQRAHLPSQTAPVPGGDDRETPKPSRDVGALGAGAEVHAGQPVANEEKPNGMKRP